MMTEKGNLSELPKGWASATIGEVADVITGTTPSKKNPDFYGGDIPFVKPGDLDRSDLLVESEETVTSEGAEQGRLLLKGSIPVSCIGILGKSALLGVEAITNQQINAVVPCKGLIPRFVYYWSKTIKPWLDENASATTVAIINKGRFSKAPISFPSEIEQRRIVAKTEELLTKLDAGVEAMKKTKAQLKRYRQSVLKTAVEGKLTEEWREAHKEELEPASVLLERIRLERRQLWEEDQLAKMKAKGNTPKDDSWMKKYKETTEPDISELPDLPDVWVWTDLNSISKEIYRYPTFYGLEHLQRGIPVIRGEHLRNDGTISNDWDNYWFISLEVSQRFPRTVVEVDDLIMCVRGSVGKIGMVDENLQKAQISPNCIRISLIKNQISPKVVLFYFMSVFGKDMVQKNVSATTIQTIKASLLVETPIPLPPFLEQKVIADEVERRLSVADEIEATIDAELKRSERLRQSILKQAFSGELVPQDPTDEPGEKLLERIKEEKAKLEAEKKPRKRARIRKAKK